MEVCYPFYDSSFIDCLPQNCKYVKFIDFIDLFIDFSRTVAMCVARATPGFFHDVTVMRSNVLFSTRLKQRVAGIFVETFSEY